MGLGQAIFVHVDADITRRLKQRLVFHAPAAGIDADFHALGKPHIPPQKKPQKLFGGLQR
jgi:hypothetical protein